MANEIFRSEFITRIRTALTRAEAITKVEHHGLAGRAREIFVKDLLQPILPPYAELGTGKISDSEGNLSREADVVIYSAETLPRLLIGAGFGIYPAEACIYSIEVKSRLTADELADAITKHRELRKLRYLSSAMNGVYQAVGPLSPPVIPALFAFKTDLAEGGKKELARYKELDNEADVYPAIPVICVAGRGYWWFKPNEPAEKWINHPPNAEHEEIIDFLTGIANTVPDQVMAKGRPRFGHYISRPRDFEKR